MATKCTMTAFSRLPSEILDIIMNYVLGDSIMDLYHLEQVSRHMYNYVNNPNADKNQYVHLLKVFYSRAGRDTSSINNFVPTAFINSREQWKLAAILQLGPVECVRRLVEAANADQRKRDKTVFKIVMFGAGNTGQSTTMYKLLTGEFHEQTDPTIEDIFKLNFQFNGITVPIVVLDTAPQEWKYSNSRYFVEGESFIFMYSIIDDGSYEFIDKLLHYDFCNHYGIESNVETIPTSSEEQAKQQQQQKEQGDDNPGITADLSHVPCVIVGNKSDLESQRVVSKQQLQLLANKYCISEYMESSAKNKDLVNQIFYLVIASHCVLKASQFGSEVKMAKLQKLILDYSKNMASYHKSVQKNAELQSAMRNPAAPAKKKCNVM